jgi:hypothetical protein
MRVMPETSGERADKGVEKVNEAKEEREKRHLHSAVEGTGAFGNREQCDHRALARRGGGETAPVTVVAVEQKRRHLQGMPN